MKNELLDNKIPSSIQRLLDMGEGSPVQFVLKCLPSKSLCSLGMTNKSFQAKTEEEMIRRNRVKSVIISENSTILLVLTYRNNLKIFAKGDNQFGQIGLGAEKNITSYKEIVFPEKIKIHLL